MLHRQLQILPTAKISRSRDATIIARDIRAEIIVGGEVAGCGVEGWLVGGGLDVAGRGRRVGDAEGIVGKGADGVGHVVCYFES